MPLMYHKDASEPVRVSDGNVETMKNRGWSLDDDFSSDESVDVVTDDIDLDLIVDTGIGSDAEETE